MAKNQRNQKTEKEQDNLRDKLISVNRVTKVVKGGRILAFVAFVVVGDGDGRVGIGKGKSKEVPIAVQKAIEEARKNMHHVSLKGDTIHHEVLGQHGASQVRLAPGDSGVIAGGALRSVFDVMGIKNVVAKSYGSTNPYNMVRAALDALYKLHTPSEIAAKRGKSVEEIFAA
jgi:small subunit ribosomal protein S5